MFHLEILAVLSSIGNELIDTSYCPTFENNFGMKHKFQNRVLMKNSPLNIFLFIVFTIEVHIYIYRKGKRHSALSNTFWGETVK